MKEKFIISVKGDCNDADYLTKLKDIKVELKDAKRIKELLERLESIDEIADYDTYNYDEILEGLAISDFIEIWNFIDIELSKEDIDLIKTNKDKLREFIGDILYEFLPLEGQSGQLCHSIVEVRLFKEIH